MNSRGSSSRRRAQFMLIGQRREQVSLHSVALSLSSCFSCLSRLASSVFLFIRRYFFSSLLLICLWTLWLRMYTPLCSITPCSIHAIVCGNVPHYQVLPSLSTKMRMCLYICNGMQTKGRNIHIYIYKNASWSFECIAYARTHMHTQRRRIITSSDDQSTSEERECVCEKWIYYRIEMHTRTYSYWQSNRISFVLFSSRIFSENFLSNHTTFSYEVPFDRYTRKERSENSHIF